MRRLLAIPAAVVVILAAAIPVSAPAQATTDPDWPWQMVFPVDGDYSSNYGNYHACRGTNCSRLHEGNDIMADKRTPVVAVGDGVVRWITPVNEDAVYPSVYLGIDHGNGWFTRYIHLDNDDEGTDNGKFYGIAEGIVYGTEVTAGQLIGWVGDSGNAEGTSPHLHFELRWKGDSDGPWDHGEDVDPYEYLVNAEHSWNGEFKDDDNSVHEANIDRIFQAGITVGCNPPSYNEFCPNDSITRGQMAAFIARALGLSEMSGSVEFDDMRDHIFEGAVDKIMTAGIGFGCDEDSYCPDQPLLRDEMAQLLVNAFGYDNPEATDYFADDDGNPHEDAINKIRNHGITVGCDTSDASLYCPKDTLTRAQMATFFVRAGQA